MVNNLEYTCGENCLYDDYFVFLTVEGTSIENVKVRVSNPWRSLKEQIKRIVGVFRLPLFDAVGFPVQYLLGIPSENEGESEILDSDDEEGREMTIADYKIPSGAHLHLISVPVCGSRYAELYYVKIKTYWKLTYQILCRYSGPNGFGFPTSALTSNRINYVCEVLNLNRPDKYYFFKIIRSGFDNIDLKYLPVLNSENKKTFLDDYFQPEDWAFTEKPVLLLLPKGVKISKRIYKRLKKEYNGTRRNV